jgi:hypothetical protein
MRAGKPYELRRSIFSSPDALYQYKCDKCPHPETQIWDVAVRPKSSLPAMSTASHVPREVVIRSALQPKWPFRAD